MSRFRMPSARSFVLMAMFSAVTLFGSLWIWTASDDAVSERRQQEVVANAVRERMSQLEKLALAQILRDKGLARAARDVAPGWAEADIGRALFQNAGVELTYILDGSNVPVFGSEDGSRVPNERFASYAPGIAPLIRGLREAEARESSADPGRSDSALAHGPAQASAIIRAVGRPFLFTAILFGSHSPEWGRVEHPAPIVLAGEPLDPEFLSALSRRFLLDDLRLETDPSADMKARDGYVALRDMNGNWIGALVWSADRRGLALFAKALTLISVLLVGFGCLGNLLARDARRAAAGLMASEARARHIALHDLLTGLPNRRLFSDRYEQAIAQLRRHPDEGAVVLLCIDIARFKDVNDRFGQNCGDEMLREVARRLLESCRAVDTVARLGGDEFAVVQTAGNAPSAAAHAERLIGLLSGPVDLSAGRAFLSCCAGVTLISDPLTDEGEALRQAHLALYRAKEQGPGHCAFFEPEMDAALKARRALEDDLRHALSANALTMVYQPQVDAHGRILGLEALVRWTHPERGPVPPSAFIPVAEECGLIEKVGMFTFRQAFLDSRRWPDVKVAVNVSARELRSTQFCDRLAALLKETGAEPSGLELEITESAVLGNDEETRATLDRLREMGFSLALDDFGTGYSSLSYLRLYPIDKIKIDRSFVVSLGAAPDAEAVVRAIVDLSRALGLRVIAEGVETREQHQRLVAIGCTDAQGYLFSRPVVADQIDTMVIEQAATQAA